MDTHPPVVVWRYAVRVAFGNAGLALVSSFFALGALFGEAGFTVFQAALFTFIGYALPGQLIAADLVISGAGLFTIAVAVWFVNARLLPLTVVLLALVNVSIPKSKSVLWINLLLSHMVAVTSWACFLGTYRNIPAELRRLYFVVLGSVLWGCGIIATVLGHLVGSQLPPPLLIVLLFLNPTYFLCVMLTALQRRGDIIAFAFGMILLPAVHHYFPQWDIVIAGVIGGSAAFYFAER